MRMEWNGSTMINQITKMTINKKCNMSIDEIMIALDYTTTKQTYLALHHHSHHAS